MPTAASLQHTGEPANVCQNSPAYTMSGLLADGWPATTVQYPAVARRYSKERVRRAEGTEDECIADRHM